MSQSQSTFESHEDDVWRQLSEKLGGEFTDEEGWRHDKVVVRSDPWVITLDIHHTSHYRNEVEHTRLRAAYVNPNGLRFNIYHEDVFSRIGHLIGMQDVRTGDDELDRMFVFKTNNEELLRQVTADRSLRSLILTEPGVHLHVRDSGDWFANQFPKGVDELVLEVEGRVKSLQRLETLYRLFAAALRGISRMRVSKSGD